MEQFIYFIQAGAGPIKIGLTRNLMDRFAVLQTANHEKLHVLCAIRGTLNDETKLLQQFATDNIHGEWFKPSDSLLNYIASLPSEMAENFNRVLRSKCECGNNVGHMKYEEGVFTGCCRRCLMIKDGRMAKLIESAKNRPIKNDEPCKVCGKEEHYLRRGRCTTCAAYFRRTGCDRSTDLIHRAKECLRCGRKPKQLTKKLCPKCYYHFKKKVAHESPPPSPPLSC